VTVASSEHIHHPVIEWGVLGILLMLAGLELWAILGLDHGAVLYSLDDAYIHLKLAANLAAGHYGVNAGEASSPSSSILWPLLLAPFATARWFEWSPLGLNLLAAVGIARLIPRILSLALGPARTGGAVAFHVTAGALVLMQFNTVALVFVGLEHSLQVLLSVLAVLELFRVAEGATPRRWLWPVLVLGPLVRYENLALTLASLAWLWMVGHRRGALLALASVVLLLAAFSLFLVASGLPPLPSSVLAKAGDPDFRGHVISFLPRLFRSLAHTWSGRWFVLLGVLLLVFAAAPGRRAERLLAVVLAAGLIAQLTFGSFGGFHRYEIYMLAVAFTATVLVHRASIRAAFRVAPRVAGTATLVLLGVASIRSAVVTAATPLAVHELHRQQYLMGRFAREVLRAPVAVNDLGLVSFRNPYFVVDLWGLGSPKALEARHAATDMAWADSLCRRHGVRVAMIYDPWFPPRPSTWTRVAELRFAPASELPVARSPLGGVARSVYGRGRNVVAANDRVSFYSLDPAHEPEVRAALERFRAELVEGAELEILR